MSRLLASALIAFQALLFLGPICGSHASASESMACCKDGEMHPASMSGEDAKACCSRCDMGKEHAWNTRLHKFILQSKPVIFASDYSLAGVIPVEQDFHRRMDALEDRWSYQKLISSSPPRLFLLQQSFLN